MNNPLFQAICRTGIFMICAQAIVQFRPNESYEKYLKLLVSVMILIQLFLPIRNLLKGVDGADADALLNSFRQSLEQEMADARRQAEEADALLEQMTLEEVRRRMEEQSAAAQWDDGQEAAGGTGGEAGKETGNVRDDQTGRTVTVEVEPVEPILGEQTGGMQIDGE